MRVFDDKAFDKKFDDFIEFLQGSSNNGDDKLTAELKNAIVSLWEDFETEEHERVIEVVCEKGCPRCNMHEVTVDPDDEGQGYCCTCDNPQCNHEWLVLNEEVAIKPEEPKGNGIAQ